VRWTSPALLERRLVVAAPHPDDELLHRRAAPEQGSPT